MPPAKRLSPARSPSPRGLLPLVCPALFLLLGIAECTASDADGDGWTVEDGDCNDSDAATYPGAAERCNGLDDDCDGLGDEDFAERHFRDADGDGLGDEQNVGCTAAEGFIAVRGDCNDTDPTVHAGAADVSGDGIDSDCGGSDGPQPSLGLAGSGFGSLQAALDAALAGDILWVGPGTWEAVDLNPVGKDLELLSTHLASSTILDARQRGRVLELVSGETSETLIEGFTFTGGSATDASGGAILVEGASPVLSRNIVKASTARSTDPRRYPDGGNGGGIALFDAQARLSQLEIHHNTSQQARVEYCTSSCSYLVSGGDGWGLYAHGGNNHFSHLSVHHNRVIPVVEAAEENDVYTRGVASWPVKVRSPSSAAASMPIRRIVVPGSEATI